MKKTVRVLFKVFLLGGLLFFVVNASILFSTKEKVYQISETKKPMQVGLILGARVYRSGNLSPILKDRVDTAVELYQNKLVERMLVSGDNGQENYDEVNAIKDYLLSVGIPAEDIFLDHAGFDTYDSMVRAKQVFEVESAYIITQEFHLPRAVYLARAQDIDAYGVIADKQKYRGEQYNQLRESLARFKSFGENLFGLQPRFLGEVIPITGDSKKSWD